MRQTIHPGVLSGTVAAIGSKSMAHRLMICAALAGGETEVLCPGTSKDIEATRACLTAMKQGGVLPCGESGSTLRFLLPVVAALGLEAEFHMEGRLPQRPLAPLDEQLEAHGAALCRPRPNILQCCGKLTPGSYILPGNVSSQYISGLLFALPLLDGPSTLTVTGTLESAPYVQMTLAALKQFGVAITQNGPVFEIPACTYHGPAQATVEGDWSNASFWLCAGAIGQPVTVTGLEPDSLQGDRAIAALLQRFGAEVSTHGSTVTVRPGQLRGIEIDATAIPDLVPVLAVVAAAASGTTRIYNAGRLRLKESDRLVSVRQMLETLGADVQELADSLVISGGTPLTGGTVDSCNDHRIAMAAAIAAILCRGPVTVLGAEAVEKSYPTFWKDYEKLSIQNADCLR